MRLKVWIPRQRRIAPRRNRNHRKHKGTDKTLGEILSSYDETDELFTAFDLETTGLNPQEDRIVEIGAVKFDRRGIISRFCALVNPGVPMPVHASAVNNITDALLADKPPLAAVLPHFLWFIKGTSVIAHNASFDCGFINESLKNMSRGNALFTEQKPPVSALPNRIVDTIELARKVFPDLHHYSLQALASFLKIDVKNAHRAEDDARVCMEIFIQCLSKP